MAKQELPVAIMVKTLEKVIKDSGLSYREIERRATALGYDINLWKILAVSKSDTERIKLLSTLDSYIEPILDVLKFSPTDFVVRMADEVQNKKEKRKTSSWIHPDLRDFMENEEARPYIELAYTNFQRDKLEERRRKIEEQLQKNKKK